MLVKENLVRSLTQENQILDDENNHNYRKMALLTHYEQLTKRELKKDIHKMFKNVTDILKNYRSNIMLPSNIVQNNYHENKSYIGK